MAGSLFEELVKQRQEEYDAPSWTLSWAAKPVVTEEVQRDEMRTAAMDPYEENPHVKVKAPVAQEKVGAPNPVQELVSKYGADRARLILQHLMGRR